MTNTVTMTFAADTAKLERSFDAVGAAAAKMGGKAKEAGEGFDRVGEAADTMDTRAMGFHDTLTGVQDSLGGLSMLAKGPSYEAFLTLGAGISDLGSGFYNTLIPSMKSTVAWLKAGKLQATIMEGASRVMRLATLGWAAAQRVLNFAFISSPIGWIVGGIGLLVGAVALIATKTKWFQTIWNTAWGGIKTAASKVWEWIKQIPGWIEVAFKKIAGFVSAPFRKAFNFIADAWNNTVGRLSWTVPSWVPGIGGNTIGVPNLPHFHTGGVVPGAPGSEMLAVLQAGERVIPAGGGGGVVVQFVGDGSRLGDLLVEVIRNAVKVRGGGNVQKALGRG